MTFFKTIGKSVYSPSFYSSVPKKKFWPVLKYFLLLILLLAVLQTAFKSNVFFREIPRGISKFINNAYEIYPIDLVITITNGKVSINQQEPYAIALPPGMKDYEKSHEEEAETINLAVIDTKTQFSPDLFDEYQTVFLLTENTIAIRKNDRNKEIRVYSLSQIKDFTFDRQKFDEIFAAISPFADFIKRFGGLILFTLFIPLLFIVYSSYRLVYLLFFAVITYVTNRILKLRFTYSQSYKISMYAITLGLIVNIILNILKPLISLPRIPYLVTLITVAVVVVNLAQMKKPKA